MSRIRSLAQARRSLGFGPAVAALALLAPAAAAPARTSTLTLSSLTDAGLSERVVVNAAGRTLYALSPETVHRLLCRSSACLTTWIPVTVPSPGARVREAGGVRGSLGRLSRPHGATQVTLRGMPLYRFAGDRARGQANGQGIHSFGGVWHAVTAAAQATSAPTPAPTPPAPEPPSPIPYGY